MGSGYGFVCKKCGNRYSVNTGIGFIFPNEYKKLVDKIKKGRYGEDWKHLFMSTPGAVVDAEKELYICKGCGNWDVSPVASIYAPDKPDSIEKPVHYVMKSDLESDYHIVKRYYHKCGKCGKRMHRATEREMISLPCPKCGGTDTAADLIMWD